MKEAIIKALILLSIMILAYIFLFWVVKQMTPIFDDYDKEDKKGKLGVFAGFVLFSGFIITPCLFIFKSFVELLKIFI